MTVALRSVRAVPSIRMRFCMNRSPIARRKNHAVAAYTSMEKTLEETEGKESKEKSDLMWKIFEVASGILVAKHQEHAGLICTHPPVEGSPSAPWKVPRARAKCGAVTPTVHIALRVRVSRHERDAVCGRTSRHPSERGSHQTH